jgi:2'-5' RNA ligase
MEHVVIPLDRDHSDALLRLRRRAGAPSPDDGHITLVSFDRLDRALAVGALRAAASTVAPFTVRAHGYGLFVPDRREVSLHVSVVRDNALDRLHRAVVAALCDAGACVAGWTEAAVWTPHITILSGGMAGGELAATVARLAEHPHPSWHLPVGAVALVSGRRSPGPEPRTVVHLDG